MIVECIKKISATTGEEIPHSTSLTIGKTYLVLEIYAEPGRNILFRLVDNEQIPALFSSTQFRTVDNSISSTWIASVGEDGIVELGPKKWLRPGFWEDYFDDVPAAIEDFEQERARILSEST